MTEINTSGQLEQLEYSVDDRLERYNKLGAPGIVALYSYDLFGLIAKKEINFIDTTYYLYDGIVRLAELDYMKNIVRYYQFGPMGYFPINFSVFNGSSINTYFYHNDHLITPMRITNESEILEWSADYSSFGNIILNINNITNDLRFPGHFDDNENGYYYNHNRFYLSNIGRYNKKDVLRYISNRYIFERNTLLLSKHNSYSYANSNPVLLIDENGQWVWYVIVGGGAVITAGVLLGGDWALQQCKANLSMDCAQKYKCYGDMFQTFYDDCINKGTGQCESIMGRWMVAFAGNPITGTAETLGGEAGEALEE